MLAVLHVEDVWPPDREAEARGGLRHHDETHPGVAHLFRRTNNIAVGGRVEGLALPSHYDFPALRRTPAELRDEFESLGWRKIVAFQTRNPMHRAHFELTLPRGEERRGQPAHPSRGGDDQARRPRPLHPGALLPGAAAATTRARPRCSRCCRSRCAWGAARGGVARHHPQELRLHPLHRRPRPRRPGQRQQGQAVLRPLRRAGAAAPAPGRARHRRWCRSRTWSTSRTRTATFPRTRSRRARARSTSRAPSCAGAWPRAARSRPGSPSPRSPTELRRTHPPRHAAGLHGLLHRPLRRRQVDDRATCCWSSCSRWAAGR